MQNLTVRDTLQRGVLHLGDVPAARLDAEILLAYVLACARTDLYARPERLVSDEESVLYYGCIARRAAREPVAYIVGTREFYGLSFMVGRGVLIPRPETEMIIEYAAAHFAKLGARFAFSGISPLCSGVAEACAASTHFAQSGSGARPEAAGHTPGALRVLDIGTGSGALAITLTRVFPEARVWATEISPAAYSWAEQNAARILAPHERARLTLVMGDLFAGVPAGAGEQFDCIVSNPPYLNEAEYRACMHDVYCYEPEEALLAPEEGLAFYRRILDALPRYLAPGGLVLFEISDSTGPGVHALARKAGFSCEIENDLAGHTRLAVLRKAE